MVILVQCTTTASVGHRDSLLNRVPLLPLPTSNLLSKQHQGVLFIICQLKSLLLKSPLTSLKVKPKVLTENPEPCTICPHPFPDDLTPLLPYPLLGCLLLFLSDLKHTLTSGLCPGWSLFPNVPLTEICEACFPLQLFTVYSAKLWFRVHGLVLSRIFP